ncbi:F0F1 ATP synthase subunit epsilon [Natranaerobius thermophilus]|uniref:ATP synthase epsilon chain n=1 Tax=Natranaerobius thermophilus (strain ATCC BAA-1301 / DSM 18059 / JW/NM-WN-LF) TaxID=457570 RepID=ATPE_NATTJ|nr:F0F1 ATP synthase subunit epsilon [Natranaerobius thermophilus]B2A3G1.1 RecName: Full=ATP synthase epsilon chain; AltName: Full=ATP synthase F1 sector epsilon subunit; AltName: Full=F-ATPase epsilon subunit [Natranaerobius thermophilus JW/NM-WN-LF]ACB86390.1 ATP synthase F1, epsilon subunit [Natranaerobius thermophilus JW/NM-WN-LF]
MARKEFQLEIVTPERIVYSDKVVSITAQAEDGRLGILHDHRPLVTKLQIAPFSFITQEGQEENVAISGSGYLEVTPQKVTVLCQTAELSHEIELERAQEAKERAEERLQASDEAIDYSRAEASLKRAIARIDAARAQRNDD